MSQKHFWGGMAVGAGVTVGAMYAAAGLLGAKDDNHVIHLEKSVQIGADLRTVFQAWSHFDRIPQYCRFITHVRKAGYDLTEWTANIDGKIFHWDAEVTQVIPNQVIGWKSVSGAQHSGRIMFAPIGNDTLVHVQMNYQPSSIFARPVLAALGSRIEGYIQQALRDFKSEFESLATESDHLADDREMAELLPPNVMIGNFGQRRPPASARPEPARKDANGTYGEDPNANPVYGRPDKPSLEFTRPPEENSLRKK